MKNYLKMFALAIVVLPCIIVFSGCGNTLGNEVVLKDNYDKLTTATADLITKANDPTKGFFFQLSANGNVKIDTVSMQLNVSNSTNWTGTDLYNYGSLKTKAVNGNNTIEMDNKTGNIIVKDATGNTCTTYNYSGTKQEDGTYSYDTANKVLGSPYATKSIIDIISENLPNNNFDPSGIQLPTDPTNLTPLETELEGLLNTNLNITNSEVTLTLKAYEKSGQYTFRLNANIKAGTALDMNFSVDLIVKDEVITGLNVSIKGKMERVETVMGESGKIPYEVDLSVSLNLSWTPNTSEEFTSIPSGIEWTESNYTPIV